MNARTETILFSVTAVLIVVMMFGGLRDIVHPSAPSSAEAAVVHADAGQPGGASAILPGDLPASGVTAAPRG